MADGTYGSMDESARNGSVSISAAKLDHFRRKLPLERLIFTRAFVLPEIKKTTRKQTIMLALPQKIISMRKTMAIFRRNITSSQTVELIQS